MRIRLWLTKLIYLLFIVWLGGLMPLIYANPFASSHTLPRYRVAILHQPIRVQALPPSLADRFSQQLFSQQTRLTSKQIASPLLTLIQLSAGYLLTAGITLPPISRAGWLPTEATICPASVSLAPPKKPPRLLFVL